MPMSGLKNHPCLVLESPPEATEDRASTTSPVPMSGTKDHPSLVDNFPASPKVTNLCWRGENPVEGSSATIPINLVSPPSTTFPMEVTQPRVVPNWYGDPEVAIGQEPVFATHPSMHSAMVVHESPQNIVAKKSPPPPPRPNHVGPISPPSSPRQGAYIQQVNGIPYLTRPSRGGGAGGGGILLVGGHLHLLLRILHPRFALQGGQFGPSLARGEWWWVISSTWG